MKKFIEGTINKRREELTALKIGDCGYQSLLGEIKKLDLPADKYKAIQVAIDKYINVN